MSTYGLFLLDHFDLAKRPDRTERALRVFFPKSATDYLTKLQHGDEVLVREGTREALEAMTANLSAQGFRTRVRALEAAGND